MRIAILSQDAATLICKCPGPQPAGACPLADAGTGRRPCAGKMLLVNVDAAGKPKVWMFKLAADIEACPVYLMGI